METIINLSLLTIKILSLLIILLIAVAYLTLAERKIIGAMQLRKGPNVAGPFGLLQPISDAIKLLFKEPIIPDKAHRTLFILAPIITFTLALAAWAVIPIHKFIITNIDLSVLYIIAISSLSVYGIIIAGWSSGSQYAFLGCIRSVAQMISYELIIGICILTVIMITGSTNLNDIVTLLHNNSWYYQIILTPMTVIFFIAALAETNRHPFDLPEAESELVAGYHVEYSSMLFALFFLGEYANMILMSTMISILFLGGWFIPFDILPPSALWLIFKICICLFIFIWIRAALPRYRYDQLMKIAWKILIPTSFGIFMIATCIIKVLC